MALALHQISTAPLHVMLLLEEQDCIQMQKSKGLWQISTSQGFTLFYKEETVNTLQHIREQETDQSISDFAILKRVNADFSKAVALNPDLYNKYQLLIEHHPLKNPENIRYEDANGFHEISDQPHKGSEEFKIGCCIS